MNSFDPDIDANATIHQPLFEFDSQHSPPSQQTVDDFLAELDPSLNDDQERAFRIIAEHSIEKTTEPLRMFIGGPGGTGKSYVIGCLNQFFQVTNQCRRFRLCSYTGVAANNINGMTLHSALNFGSVNTIKTNSVSHRDLIAMWEGVDYLFIDEVSMIGCAFLYRISLAL
ncbi:hypothetical protein EV361DRAFT_801831, partial [Lentinula raphanica]